MAKLTNTSVESLKGTGRTKYEPVALGGSLVARGLANKVRYYYQYWQNGAKARCPLGEHSRNGDGKGSADSTAYTLAGARARAIKLAALKQEHGDLLGYMREQRYAATVALQQAEVDRTRLNQEARDYSLGNLCMAYWKHLETEGKASARDVRNALKLWVLRKHPNISSKKASEVNTEDVLIILRSVIEAGHTTTTNRVRSYLSAAYTFGLGSITDPLASSRAGGFRLTNNPVAPVKRVASFEKTGERFLNSHEMGELLRRLESKNSTATKTIILSLRLGGQRITQLLATSIADYDTENNTLTLKDIKGRRTQPRLHILPVVDEIAPLITEAIKNPHPKRNGLFHGLTMETVSKQVRQISEEMETSGAEPFGWRDLRRTCETMLAKMGVPKDLRAQIQSHGLGGVQDKHYDKHLYIEEKRKALEAWNKRLDQLKAETKNTNYGIATNH